MTQTKRKVEAYFPTLVQYSQVEDLQEMNKTLLPAIEEIKRTIPNTVPSDGSSIHYSTINSGENIIGLENFAPLRAFIMAEGINFANTLGLNIQKQPLKLDESWLNVHGDREYQEPHIHPNSVISGVYYAKAPNNCGDLLIHSPFIYVMHQPLQYRSRTRSAWRVRTVAPSCDFQPW